MEQKVMKDRLDAVFNELRYHKLISSQKDFAAALGKNKSHINEIFNGKKPVTEDLLNAMVVKFGVNEHWLATGEPPIIKELHNTVYEPPGRLNPRLDEAKLRGDLESDHYYMNNAGRVFTQIGEGAYLMHTPLVSQKAKAGYMVGWGDESYVSNLPTFPIVIDKPNKGYYLSFEVTGDSMDDGSKLAISEGDIVTGRRVERDYWKSKLHIRDYPDFIIHHKDGLIVKRIIAHDVAKGIITCHSLNPDKKEYPDFDLQLCEVSQLFNIIKVTTDRKAR